jgi:hypothetical protein
LNAYSVTRTTPPLAAESRARREDASVARSADICAVCQRPRTRGPHSQAGDVFICADCEAAAKQFIEIQDRMWVEAGQEGESTDETDDPARR